MVCDARHVCAFVFASAPRICRMELSRLKREVLHRHADELEAVLGPEKMLAAEEATTVARFHELVTMQVCGDEPDDDMRYR